jgi:ribosomal protein L22
VADDPQEKQDGEEPVPASEEPSAPEAAEPEVTVEPPAEPEAAEAEAAEAEPVAAEPAAVEAEQEPVAEATEPEAAPAEEAPATKPKRAASAKTEKPAPAKKDASKKQKPARKPRGPQGERQVVRAEAKYVHSSARKARLVCDHIRGKSVIEARAILMHAPRAVAENWSKLLESAVANAENNHELVGEDLRILSVYADEGPTIKRFRPRAMGRATKIRKRTSHLTITLTPKE